MLVRLATALDPARVRPVVVCLKEAGPWGSPLIDKGIPVHEHLLRHKFDFSVVRRLAGLLRQHRPACIMAVGSGGDRMFWSTLAARLTGSPMVVWSHLFPALGAPGFEWINRRLFPWVHAVVALGRRHAEALADVVGAPARRISVIRNGIDVDPLDRPDLREEARRILGIASDQVAIGMVANLRPIKRVDTFIEAAMRLNRRDARFFVIGDGPDRGDLESQLRRSGPIQDRMTLLGPREDVPMLVQGFDIVCLTSEREVLSVAMLEAMAAGKAFVAPRVGSLDEALIDGETGRFFEPDTVEAFMAVLTELLDDPQQRMCLGQASRAKVRAEFRIDQMARAFEDLVERLCTRGVDGA